MKVYISFLILGLSWLVVANNNFGDYELLRKYHLSSETRHKKKYNLRFRGVYEGHKLTINMLPHSHDDVGWLKTVQEYYDGVNELTQRACVRDIITSVIGVLASDPEKKFILQEIAFFKKWWRDQNDHTKSIVKNLIKNGQLEFVGGGYTQNDEATVHYEDVIDQVTLGHKFLKDTLDFIPTTAWQIDTFGHSSSHASLLAQMGFDSVFFARIHYEDKKNRLDNREMEFIWKPKMSSGEELSILAHVNYFHYEAPEGFCFDPVCHHPVQIVDDPESDYNNIESKSDDMVEYFKSMALNYKHRSMIHTFGSDFQYTNAFHNFQNMDKLLGFIKKNEKKYNVDIKYQLPNEYIKELTEYKKELSTYTKDFFPYADYPKIYWTGYFTTRPTFKGAIRAASRFLQATRSLLSLLLAKVCIL